jgi:hypothetical protein
VVDLIIRRAEWYRFRKHPASPSIFLNSERNFRNNTDLTRLMLIRLSRNSKERHFRTLGSNGIGVVLEILVTVRTPEVCQSREFVSTMI